MERKVLQFLGQLCGSHIKEGPEKHLGIGNHSKHRTSEAHPCHRSSAMHQAASAPKKESSGSLEEWNKNQDMVFRFSFIFFLKGGFSGAVERLIGVAVGTFIEYFPFETH